MQMPDKAPLMYQGVDPTPHWTRIDFALVSVLILLGFLLRIPGINQGLWIDEIFTLVDFVRLSAAEIINQPGLTNNHVLYSLLAHQTVAWFGESAWALRLPALIFGVATIPAIYHFGRQIAPRQEALLAALFVTLNYQFVWYSQNARGYTGLLFGALLASSLFIRLVVPKANPSALIVLGYAVVAALTVWIHLTAVFLVLAHALIGIALATNLLRARRVAEFSRPFAALLLATLFALAVYSPMFNAEKVQHTRVGDGTSGLVEQGKAAEWAFEEFTQGLKRSMPGGWPLILMVFAVLLAGFDSYLRQGIYVLTLLVLPALITIAVITGIGALFFPRFLFCSAGFLLLIGVRGGFRMAEFILPFLSRGQVFFIGLLFALAGVSQVPSAWKPKQDFAAAAEFINENRRPGDAVVCLSKTRFPLAEFHGIDCKDTVSLVQLVRIEQQHERTWLLYTLPTTVATARPEIWSRIRTESEYQLIREFRGTLYGGTVSVMLKQPAATENVTNH